MKKKIIVWILCAAAFACAYVYGVRLNDLNRRYRSDLQYAFVTVEQSAYREIEDETYVVGTYLVEDGKTAKAGPILRSEEVSLITVDFSLRDLFGAGAELAEGDTDGCVLSSALCYALYGSGRAAGQQVTVDGKQYIVRAVFDAEEPMMFVQQEQDASGIWAQTVTRQVSGVVLDISEESYRGQDVQEYAGRHGTDADDYYYVKDYLKLFPAITLPPEWSDFDSWGSVMEEWQEMKERRLYQNKDAIEIYYYRLRQTFIHMEAVFTIMSACFVAFFVWSLSLRKKRKTTDSRSSVKERFAVRRLKHRDMIFARDAGSSEQTSFLHLPNFRHFALHGTEVSDPESSSESGNSSE